MARRIQGERQWVEMTIKDPYGPEIGLSDAELKWGKYYHPDVNTEISTGDVNKIRIKEGGSYKLGAAGRRDASSGCEGSYHIFDVASGKTIGTVYFDCSWSRTNAFSIGVCDALAWGVAVQGGNFSSTGPLGSIDITAIKTGLLK